MAYVEDVLLLFPFICSISGFFVALDWHMLVQIDRIFSMCYCMYFRIQNPRWRFVCLVVLVFLSLALDSTLELTPCTVTAVFVFSC